MFEQLLEAAVDLDRFFPPPRACRASLNSPVVKVFEECPGCQL